MKYSNSINVQEDVSSESIENYNIENDPTNQFCCNKWIGGGTIGLGLRSSLCDCLDVVLEGRYARYNNTCYTNNKDQNIDEHNGFELSDLAEKDSTKFRTDSYMALAGINWRF